MKKQLLLDVHDELFVDNFAGGGGASVGVEMGLNRSPDIAVNHNADAMAMHAANHPTTRHLIEDVFRVNPLLVCGWRKVRGKWVGGRRVGGAWFSPDCTDFSKAKGGKPKSKKIRGLAWVAVKWARSFKCAGLSMPRVMYLENVEEFQEWGPLLADGTRCPQRRGQTFNRYILTLRNLGYDVEWRDLRAMYAGAGTTRKRLFIIMRCDGKPIVWPQPSHGPGHKPFVTAADSIDFSLPCPSIFMTKAEAKAYTKATGHRINRPLVEATMRRIAKGFKKFVVDDADPFIVNFTHQGSDNRVESIREPFKTITGAHRGEKGLIMPSVIKFRTGATGHKVTEPLHTITAGPVEDPAGAAHALGVVEARVSLINTRNGERQGQQPRTHDIRKPLNTITAEGSQGAVVAAFLAKHFGGHETPGSALKKPFDTVTATDHHGLVAAHVIRHFGEGYGSAATEPLGAVMADGGGKTGLVTSHIAKMYGTTTGQDNRRPIDVITGGGTKFAEVRAFLMKYYTTGDHNHQGLKEPVHTIRGHDGLALIMVHGEEYAVLDIGMRMLTPRELFNAQGFPRNYIIDPLVYRRRGKKMLLVRMPQDAQVRCVGNSVCPPQAAALVRANNPEMRIRQRRRRAA